MFDTTECYSSPKKLMETIPVIKHSLRFSKAKNISWVCQCLPVCHVFCHIFTTMALDNIVAFDDIVLLFPWLSCCFISYAVFSRCTVSVSSSSINKAEASNRRLPTPATFSTMNLLLLLFAKHENK